MILDFPTFYRNYGLRRVNQLMTPRFHSAAIFQLPRSAIIHFAHGDRLKYGPDKSDIAFRGFITKIKNDGQVALKPMARQIWMDHVTQLTNERIGIALKGSGNAALLVRQFHQTYKKFQRVTALRVALADANALLAINYDIIPHLVRYQRNAYNNYFEWINLEKTVWENIAKVAGETDHPQFIIRHMPQVLPARSSLQQYRSMNQKTPNRRVLSVFHSQEHLFLAELWKWIGVERSTSVISAVPRDKLKHVNIVFIEAGKWIVINLGVLDSWRRPAAEEMLAGEEERKNLILPQNFQNMLLRTFMSINQLRSIAGPEIAEVANQVTDKEDAVELRRDLVNVQSGEDKLDQEIRRNQLDATIKAVETNAVIEPADTAATVNVDAQMLASINDDLEAMEKIRANLVALPNTDDEETEVSIDGPAEPEPPLVLKRPELHEAVMNVVNRHAEAGLISGAQYRHFETVAHAYKKIIAPDGESTLAQYVDIKPEMLAIEEQEPMVQLRTVADKSMLKSSLQEFTPRYIEQVFHRDVASMALAVQYAGVAVADYQQETIHSITGSFTMHTMRLIPTEGAASTIRFKLPLIEPDGSYSANGTKYSLRGQRGDKNSRIV